MRNFRWTPSFHVNRESSLVPVWFFLPILLIYLFEKHCFFSIVSTVGRPLFMDTTITTLVCPSVARVCTEVNLLREIPYIVWIVTEKENGGFW